MTRALVVTIMLVSLATRAHADPVVAGDLRSYVTSYSIGLEWDVTGDTNHDARVDVQYSIAGTGTWQTVLPLFRIDSKGSNMVAGSVLFLRPATTYDLQLELVDPDGGGETRQVSVTTRPIPTRGEDGPVYHVVPGSGGGSGTDSDPFAGIAAAQEVATPGDTFLLHGGDYGGPVAFDTGGGDGAYVAWVAAGDGAATFAGITVEASWLWLEGLEVTLDDNAVHSAGDLHDVVLKGNRVTGCHYCIHLNDGDEAWWISDNVIIGNEPPTSGSFSGEGIELQHTSGHTVAYNSISFVADGISYPTRNVDIFGNDIFETSDDGIEPDYGLENIRVWGNRIHHPHHNGISFQPMDGGPWYVLRNQIIGFSESALKLRDVTHALVAHNTMVGWTRVLQGEAGWIRNMKLRNNLLVTMTGDYIIEDTGSSGVDDNWRTDLDYDGVAWAESSEPKFKWDNVRYDDLAAFQAGSGQEAHGLELPLTCFETLDVPGAPPAVIPPHQVTLAASCAAVDTGEVLPGINDDFVGAGPDLGAHERGAPPTHYGPRAADLCGDGNLEAYETCDPPETCPTDCDDDDACTIDHLEGDASACTAACFNDPITACQAGDGCCPAGCTLADDPDCTPEALADAGITGDGGSTSDGAPVGTDEMGGGCGCRAAPTSPGLLLWLAFLAVLALPRRLGHRRAPRSARG